MIELIIAIVVIGIVLMSAPMLLQQAAKSGYVAIQQEAINEAASQVNMVLGYHWDENSADERFIDPILTAAGGDTNLIEYNNTGRRAGTPKESKRAFVRDDGLRLPASALGSDGGDRDDIDDLAGNAQLTLIEDAASDYVEKTRSTSIPPSHTSATRSAAEPTWIREATRGLSLLLRGHPLQILPTSNISK